MALNSELALEVQKSAPSAIIDLFEMSLYPEITSDTAYMEPIRFHSGVSGIEQNIIWQGNEYVRFPVEFTGFESNAKGTIPRPTVKVANLAGAISSLLYKFENLIGAKVTRKRTMYKYLDAINFPDGQNPDENQEIEFPNEIYYVSRKVVENNLYVELELSPSWDLQGIKLPRRLCTQNICMWQYKGLECGYGEVATLVRLQQAFANTGTPEKVVVTSNTHNLQPNDGVYLRFPTAYTNFNATYNITEVTTNTFTLLIPGWSAVTSGLLDFTNRFDSADNPIFNPSEATTADRCSKRLSSCKMRYGTSSVLPYGAFPAVGWIR